MPKAQCLLSWSLQSCSEKRISDPGASQDVWHGMREVRWIPEVHPWDMSVGGESEKA